MFMITKQGKNVNYSDILLYSVNMKDIIVIVNDEEQMKKFMRTGKGTDAPIAVLPYSDEELTMMLSAAKSFVMSQTGLDKDSLDNHEDISIVVMVLIQDMFENRTMYVEKSNVNKVVDSILGMYRTNFLPGVNKTWIPGS